MIAPVSHRGPRAVLLLVGIAAVLAAMACGPAVRTGARAPSAAAEAGGGEAAGAEASLVPYKDARYGYRVDAPGAMTARPDGSAATAGGTERLAVTVVSAADAAALAKADLTKLSAAAGYSLVDAPRSIRLGAATVRLAYVSVEGTSAVTGKPIERVNVRYYAPKDGATVAVIAYSIPRNQFDPQGADDVARTFAWR